MTEDKTETTKSYDTIKLGIDAHAKWDYVARQLVGAAVRTGDMGNKLTEE